MSDAQTATRHEVAFTLHDLIALDEDRFVEAVTGEIIGDGTADVAGYELARIEDGKIIVEVEGTFTPVPEPDQNEFPHDEQFGVLLPGISRADMECLSDEQLEHWFAEVDRQVKVLEFEPGEPQRNVRDLMGHIIQQRAASQAR